MNVLRIVIIQGHPVKSYHSADASADVISLTHRTYPHILIFHLLCPNPITDEDYVVLPQHATLPTSLFDTTFEAAAQACLLR